MAVLLKQTHIFGLDYSLFGVYCQNNEKMVRGKYSTFYKLLNNYILIKLSAYIIFQLKYYAQL